MVEAFEKLAKAAAVIAHKLVLAQKENAELWAANEAATQPKLRKRKRVQQEGLLTIDEGKWLSTIKEFGAHSNGERAKKSRKIQDQSSTQQRCRNCNKPGHNTRTCKQAADSLDT